MITHEGRGDHLHHVARRREFSEEGGGEDTAQLSPPLAYENWAGCARFTVLWAFCLWRCGWRLIKPTNGAPKPQSSRHPSELPGVFGGGWSGSTKR